MSLEQLEKAISANNLTLFSQWWESDIEPLDEQTAQQMLSTLLQKKGANDKSRDIFLDLLKAYLAEDNVRFLNNVPKIQNCLYQTLFNIIFEKREIGLFDECFKKLNAEKQAILIEAWIQYGHSEFFSINLSDLFKPMSDEAFTALINKFEKIEYVTLTAVKKEITRRMNDTVLKAYLTYLVECRKQFDQQLVLEIYNTADHPNKNALLKTLLIHPETSAITLSIFIEQLWRGKLILTLKNLCDINEFANMLLGLPEKHWIFFGYNLIDQSLNLLGELFHSVLEELPIENKNYRPLFIRILEGSRICRNKQLMPTLLANHRHKLHSMLSDLNTQDPQFITHVSDYIKFINAQQRTELLTQFYEILTSIPGALSSSIILDLLQDASDGLGKKSLSNFNFSHPLENESDKQLQAQLSQIKLNSQSVAELRKENPVGNGEFAELPTDIASALIFDNILTYLHSKHQKAIDATLRGKGAWQRYDERVSHFQKIYTFITDVLQQKGDTANLSKNLNSLVNTLTYPQNSTFMGKNCSDDNYKKYIQALLQTPAATLIIRFNEMVKKLNRLAQTGGTRPHVTTLHAISAEYYSSCLEQPEQQEFAFREQFSRQHI